MAQHTITHCINDGIAFLLDGSRVILNITYYIY